MRNIARLGAIILTFSLSLFVLALVRGASTRTGTSIQDVGPYTSIRSAFDSYARDVRIRVGVEKGLDLTLTDSNGMAIMSAQNVDSSTELEVHLDRRGLYNITLYNPNNLTQRVTLDITYYNLEADIIQGATAFSVIGASLIIAQWIRDRAKHSARRQDEKQDQKSD